MAVPIDGVDNEDGNDSDVVVGGLTTKVESSALSSVVVRCCIFRILLVICVFLFLRRVGVTKPSADCC